MLRAFLFLLPWIATAQSWNSVQALTPGTKIEVRTASAKSKGTLVSAASDSVVLRDKRGDHSFMLPDVREVKIRSVSQQVRRGMIGTAIGIGAGIASSLLICHSCINESNDRDFIRYGAQGGGFFGALVSFPFPAYKTVYKTPKR
jgi:hypothetical protein